MSGYEGLPVNPAACSVTQTNHSIRIPASVLRSSISASHFLQHSPSPAPPPISHGLGLQSIAAVSGTMQRDHRERFPRPTCSVPGCHSQSSRSLRSLPAVVRVAASPGQMFFLPAVFHPHAGQRLTIRKKKGRIVRSIVNNTVVIVTEPADKNTLIIYRFRITKIVIFLALLKRT